MGIKFQKGATVTRTGRSYEGVIKGKDYVVAEVLPHGLRLKGYGMVVYDARFFELPTEPAPVKPDSGGRKDDGGKLDFTLLDDMPNALEAVVEVMQWATTKKAPKPYARGSWQGVEPDRYRAAIGRHDNGARKQAVSNGEPVRYQRDDETQLLHLAHIATSALFALESTIRELKGKKQ